MRLWAIDFGLPHRFHPDEPFEVFRALQLGAGEFDFTRVLKGGYYLVLFGAYAAYFLVLLATGRVSSPHDLGLRFAADPTPFWLIGRVLTAVLGTATLAVVYAIARRMGRPAALFGTGALAVTLLHVKDSHYIAVDVPQGLVVAMAFLFIVRFAELGRVRELYGGLLLIAAATAFKAPAAVLVLPWVIAVVHRLRAAPDRGRLVPHAILAVVVGALLFLALAPGVLVRIGVLELDSAQVGTSRRPSDAVFVQLGGQYRVEGWRLYPRFLWNDFGGFWGVGLLAMNVAAVLASAIRRRLLDVLYLGFLIPTVVGFFFFSPLAAGRYLLPALVLTAPFVGRLASDAIVAAQRRWASQGGRWVAAGLYVVLALSAAGCLRWDLWQSRPDTRELALAWIQRNVPVRSRVLLSGNVSFPEAGTVPLPIDTSYLREQAQRYRQARAPNKARYLEEFQIPASRGAGYEPVYVSGNGADDLAAYLEDSVSVFIVDEGLLKRASSLSGQRAFPELHQLLTELRAQSDVRLAAAFAPSVPERPGPRLWIYVPEPAAALRTRTPSRPALADSVAS